MKRFGRYNNDFNNMFECYARVGEKTLPKRPNITRLIQEEAMQSSGTTYNGLKYVKIFKQLKGRGADMAYLGKVESIDSDNGKGGVILTATDSDQTIHVATSGNTADIKVSVDGETVDQFETTTPVKFDSESKELTIIQTEEV